MNNAVYRAHAVKSSPMMHRTFALLVLAASALAQTKPTLLPADYGKWETLGAGTLSPDGKWLAYDVRRTSGDGELRIAPVAGGKSQTVPFCSAPAYSSDSRWLACSATVSEADQEKARKARRPVQTKLAIVDLSSGAVTNVEDVQSFAFAGDGPYVAFRKYAPTPAEPAGTAATAAAGAGRGGRGGRGGGGDGETERDPVGAVLLVRNLATGVDTTFGNVTNYAWQDKGSNLAITIGVEGRTGNALQIFDPHAGSLKVLDNGPAVFSSLTWRKDSNDLAAFRSVKQDGYEGDTHIALAWKNLADKLTVKVDAPQRIVGSRAPVWSEDGATIYVGVAPWNTKLEVKKSDDDPATVEVWHWQDVNVISEQKLTAARDRDRNATAVWHLASGKLTQLTTNLKEDVRLPRTGSRALALDGVPYQNDSMFGRNFVDLYKVDMETGARSEIAKHLTPPVEFSPSGRYAMNFKEGDFWLYDLESGAVRNITKDSKLALTNKENDYPVSQKPAYGVAGWTKGDRSVIVYDTNDLWEVAADGSGKPKRLTDGAAEDIRFRYVRVAAGGAGGGRGGRGGGGSNEAIDLDKPVYLSLEGRWTKKTGYAVLENGKVDRLVYEEKGVRGLEKAKDTDVYTYQAGAWNESPNFFAGHDLEGRRQSQRHQPLRRAIRLGQSRARRLQELPRRSSAGRALLPRELREGQAVPDDRADLRDRKQPASQLVGALRAVHL